MEHLHNLIHNYNIPILLTIGLVTIIGFYFGRNMRYLKLPTIIGYMVLGVILGPSGFDLLSDDLQEKLGFIPDIALGFVALSIGLELNFKTLQKLGKSIVYIIIFESFGAFFLVFIGLYLLTHNFVMSLVFASIAPASAPAGTVAVIQEFKARGNLTKALYAVVGFDDGLGIIIFGFSLAVVQDILLHQTGAESAGLLLTIFYPLKEILISLVVAGVISTLYAILGRKLKNSNDILILTIGFVLITCGFCQSLHLSLILTNMIIGMVIVNTQSRSLLIAIQERLPLLLPLLFILFFTLAGANLHVNALPALGVLGVVYIFSRSFGLIGGSRLGAIWGGAEKNIKNYLGLGILSQAGVAIGLSLMLKQEIKGMGMVIDTVSGKTSGDEIGSIVITTITATCIFFEIIGPILTKIALKKAGEISIGEKNE
ncbi:MAG: cation:proton antiporter [Candidatus Cloacimonadales bacterium]|nr:cation:proton antiporter [Candidatus Cloacimonadales bacterium]